MAKKTKHFRIFIHNYLSFRPSFQNAEKKISKIQKTLNFFFRMAFNFCFHTGLLILKFALALLKYLGKEAAATKNFFYKRLKILKQPQFYWSLGLFVATGLTILAGFQSAKIVAHGLDLKSKIFGVSFLGARHLEEAKNALAGQNFDRAENQFLLAYNSFSESQQQIKSAGDLINGLLNFLPQKRDAGKVLDGAVRIAQAGEDSVNFYKQVAGLKFSPQGIISQGRPTAEILNNSSSLLANIYANLSKANEEISGVNINSIPANSRENFVSLKEKLSLVQKGIAAFREIFNLAKTMALGHKNVLLLFENNNELRATGGFIGTYGKMSLDDGAIKNIKISSIYDLDGQLEEKIRPPLPILNINDRWFMRDGNWFANFPDSAKKIINFYEKEGEETPNLIIALTPNLITDLLKLTGPVRLPSHSLTVDADNFVEYMQYSSTISSPVFQNNPKQVLADFFPALLQKLSELDAEDMGLLAKIFQKNLNGKQLIFYSPDPNLQRQFQDFHCAGEVLPSDRDYLSVVGSNLGGTKTDLYIKQQIDLKTSLDPEGFVINELTITRTNTLPKLEKTGNTSFLRILVPLGGKLVSNTGFDRKNLDLPGQQGYKVDSDAYNWEKNTVKDVTSGTLIGREADKTFFGNWLTVEGGETKTIKIVYTLPLELKNIDRFSLLIQKQMGSTDGNFNYQLDFSGYKLEWKNLNKGDLQTSSFKDQLVIDKDYFLGFVFSKQ